MGKIFQFQFSIIKLYVYLCIVYHAVAYNFCFSNYSKTFYQQLRSSERQSLVGPPESMREHVVAAAKAMRCGNWNACATFIVNKKMNTKVWDLFYEADRVREMLTKFIKEESLRTYLFTYSNVYTSISIPSLVEMFELTKSKVHSLISKMIINGELMASLDDPTETVVMHRSEPSRLQALSMQLADKVTNLVDANERIFELKQGNMFQRGFQVCYRILVIIEVKYYKQFYHRVNVETVETIEIKITNKAIGIIIVIETTIIIVTIEIIACAITAMMIKRLLCSGVMDFLYQTIINFQLVKRIFQLFAVTTQNETICGSFRSRRCKIVEQFFVALDREEIWKFYSFDVCIILRRIYFFASTF